MLLDSAVVLWGLRAVAAVVVAVVGFVVVAVVVVVVAAAGVGRVCIGFGVVVVVDCGRIAVEVAP